MKRILMIFLIIAGGYILFTSIGSMSWFSGKENNSVSVTDKIDTIEFDISTVSMTIIPDNRENLETVYGGKGKVTVEQKGDTIKVEHERPWYLLFSFFNSSKLTVYIPENYDRDMQIDVGSGNVALSGKSSQEPFELNELSLNIGSGNVELGNLSVNEFSHDGSSGNLTVHSLVTEKSTIDLSSGNTKLMGFVGKLEADISSGKLDVQIDELVDSVHIDVSSGDVSLDLPEKADFTFKGEVGSGNISNNFPLTNQKQDNRDISGIHGSGEHDVEIDVSSGNVKIY